MPATQKLLFADPRPLVERLGRDFFRRLPQTPGVYLTEWIQGKVTAAAGPFEKAVLETGVQLLNEKLCRQPNAILPRRWDRRHLVTRSLVLRQGASEQRRRRTKEP